MALDVMKEFLEKSSRRDRASRVREVRRGTEDGQATSKSVGVATRNVQSHVSGTGISAYLENGIAIEYAQAIAAHESQRPTKLYDGTSDELTLDEIQRIVI